MIRAYFLLLIIFASTCVSAQVKHNIVRTYNFFREQVPGIAMADDAGNILTTTRDTSYFMYVETKGFNKPSIDSVHYGRKIFYVDVIGISSFPVIAGKRKENEEIIKLRKGKGNSLWLVEMHFISEGKRIYREPIISGKKNGRRYHLPTREFVELYPEEKG